MKPESHRNVEEGSFFPWKENDVYCGKERGREVFAR